MSQYTRDIIFLVLGTILIVLIVAGAQKNSPSGLIPCQTTHKIFDGKNEIEVTYTHPHCEQFLNEIKRNKDSANNNDVR